MGRKREVSESRDLSARIHEVARAIPRGKVATYGQLALLAGIPAGHRVAARAMQHCPSALPWQRVVAKKDARRAKIALQDSEHAALQRALLESEGIVFDANGFISLARWGFLPGEAGPRKRAPKAADGGPAARAAEPTLPTPAKRAARRAGRRQGARAKLDA